MVYRNYLLFAICLFLLISCSSTEELGKHEPSHLSDQASSAAGLTKEQIAEVISKNMSSVIKCYEDELKLKKGLAGKIILNFEVGSEGKVITSQIANSTLNHPPTETCIVKSSKTWVFPKPEGNAAVQVNYPFIFKFRKK